MSSKTIILFRSKTDDSSNEDVYEKLLIDHGYRVKTISPIQFHFVNSDLLSSKLNSNHYYALIFTSKRAVEATQRVLKEGDKQIWQRIYVEGPATGMLVKEVFGPTTDIRGAECGGSESLADYIIQDVGNVNGNINLLFPCAQARLDKLPKRLTGEKGIHLDEVIVYETVPSDTLEHELKEYFDNYGTPDALGFFSPSGFDSVLKASQHIGFDLTNEKLVLISLGKTTSAAIRDRLAPASFHERTCSKPTAEEFLRVVQSLN